MNTRLSQAAAAVLTLLIPPTVLAGSVRPEAGTDPAAIDLRSIPGVVRYGDGFAIPLAAARLAWYTSDLEAQVLAAPGATTIPPSNDLESAIVTFLSPAAYTAVVRGVHDASGVALVDAYALD